MNSFSVTLAEKIKRTPSIESFRFKTKEKVDFLPGQFLKVIFDADEIQNKQLNKYLSFSSSPTKEYIEVTKRLSNSAFSAHLRELKIEESILMQGPMGNCIYKEEYRKIGFLIGGIGITPVISILEYMIEKKLDTDIVLVYSNRNNAEIAFRPEIDKWAKENKKMRVFYTVTDCESDDGVCMHGHINGDILKEKIQDLPQRRFFLYGPPGMVNAMKDLCIEYGCDKNKVMAENFVGY